MYILMTFLCAKIQQSIIAEALKFLCENVDIVVNGECMIDNVQYKPFKNASASYIIWKYFRFPSSVDFVFFKTFFANQHKAIH